MLGVVVEHQTPRYTLRISGKPDEVQETRRLIVCQAYMLPYSVNSPRFHKGKSGKMRQSNTLLIVGVVTLLLTGLGGLWYIRSKSAHVTGLLAVITEHGKQSLQPSVSRL